MASPGEIADVDAVGGVVGSALAAPATWGPGEACREQSLMVCQGAVRRTESRRTAPRVCR